MTKNRLPKNSHFRLPAFISVAFLLCCGPASEDIPKEEDSEISAATRIPGRENRSDSLNPVDSGSSPGSVVLDGEWTAGIQTFASPESPVLHLTAVRSAQHQDFDRTVFQFREAGIPGFHVEYVDEPVRACGSGDAVALPGQGWLSVSMTPVQAHSEEGGSLLEQRQIEVNLPILKKARLTCDFEGVVTWVLAVSSPNRYRVFALEDPSRLVVDIRH